MKTQKTINFMLLTLTVIILGFSAKASATPSSSPGWTVIAKRLDQDIAQLDLRCDYRLIYLTTNPFVTGSKVRAYFSTTERDELIDGTGLPLSQYVTFTLSTRAPFLINDAFINNDAETYFDLYNRVPITSVYIVWGISHSQVRGVLFVEYVEEGFQRKGFDLNPERFQVERNCR